MPKGEFVRLLLVRSGSTAWEDSGRIQGSTDLPMSESGREEAAAGVAGVLCDGTVGLVLTGPDEASRETAAMLADRCRVKVKVEEELGELHLGLWEGLLESDLEERYPSAGRTWRDAPDQVQSPQGEPLGDARRRLTSVLCRVVERHRGETLVAVVLRPMAMGLVRCWLADEPCGQVWANLRDCPMVEAVEVRRDRLRVLEAAGSAG